MAPAPRIVTGVKTEPSITPASEQRVTASDLVRQFGIWQERAARAPVYILHRGRPRLVLTSLDVMDALCAPLAGDSEAIAQRDGLLAATRDAVFTCQDGAIAPASAAARALYGAGPVALDSLASSGGEFLAAALARVLGAGASETIEIVPARLPDRLWSVTVSPQPGGGALLVARDVTSDTAAQTLAGAHDALGAAMAVAGGIAVARLTLRGYVTGDTAALAALTGVSAQALATARFAALFDTGSRIAVGEALDAVMAGGATQRAEARLLVNRGGPEPVVLGLAPLRARAAIEGAVALLARAPADR